MLLTHPFHHTPFGLYQPRTRHIPAPRSFSDNNHPSGLPPCPRVPYAMAGRSNSGSSHASGGCLSNRHQGVLLHDREKGSFPDIIPLSNRAGAPDPGSLQGECMFFAGSKRCSQSWSASMPLGIKQRNRLARTWLRSWKDIYTGNNLFCERAGSSRSRGDAYLLSGQSGNGQT
jgi:hypothetical protein